MAKVMPAALGSAVFQPGLKSYGELPLAQHLGGNVAAPVVVACGRRPGPVLWVQAAIHGGEIGGTLAITRCVEQLDLATMSGAIVGIMAANPLAFRAQTRQTPEDGENMNRVFPGSSNAPITSQMANRLLAAAMSTADAAMDLHSGGAEAIVPFYSLYWDDGSPASKLSAQHAESTGADTVWRARDSWLAGAMFTRLTMAGKPALIVECGGESVAEAHIENFVGAIKGVAQSMGILPGPPPRQQRYRTIGSCDLAFTTTGGFFVPSCAAGDNLDASAVVGRVFDVFGRKQETITTPKPCFIAAIGRRYLPVHAGAMIAELSDDHGWA